MTGSEKTSASRRVESALGDELTADLFDDQELVNGLSLGGMHCS